MASSAVTNGDDKAGKDKQASAPTLPNQTLFVGNLNVKVKKDDLRRALYCIFSTHGPVLDVVALKSSKMRGAAHVVYRDIPTSTQAMRALQGTDFLGKEMVWLRFLHCILLPPSSSEFLSHPTLHLS